MKIVRDGIKELYDRGALEPLGRTRDFRQVSPEEAKQWLRLKALEEFSEVLAAGTPEERQDELYDLIDVARALLELEGGGYLADRRHEHKVKSLGLFQGRWVLDGRFPDQSPGKI